VLEAQWARQLRKRHGLRPTRQEPYRTKHHQGTRHYTRGTHFVSALTRHVTLCQQQEGRRHLRGGGRLFHTAMAHDALQRWELENSVKTGDDEIFYYDEVQQSAIQAQKPWLKDPMYFKRWVACKGSLLCVHWWAKGAGYTILQKALHRSSLLSCS
jgi:hypothetical protein